MSSNNRMTFGQGHAIQAAADSMNRIAPAHHLAQFIRTRGWIAAAIGLTACAGCSNINGYAEIDRYICAAAGQAFLPRYSQVLTAS
jgi:hypothetical protein